MGKKVIHRLFFFGLLSTILALVSCDQEASDQKPPRTDFKTRVATLPESDSLVQGTSYLSVYSQIYSFSEHTQHELTVTVSLRNTDENNSFYLQRADYFDSHGDIIKKYLSNTVEIKPLETLEIIINEDDISGGTGANFLFDWVCKIDATEPIFEAVMISTKGQQGLSFTTTAKRIR